MSPRLLIVSVNTAPTNAMKALLLHFIYTVLMTALLPLAILRLLWKSRKNSDYRKRIGERLAVSLPSIHSHIWIHTVSVGEFLATLPLIESLLSQNQQLLITTTTPTGSAMLKQRLGERVAHCYLPFDVPILVRLFLQRTQPSVAVFVETEIWANYLHTLKKRHTPTLLINARLSEKSFSGYSKLGEFTQQTIACFTEIACQNKASQQRFQQLGGNATLLGNIKFDLAPPADLAERKIQLRALLGEKPFVLAASTHKGEDEIILQAFQSSDYANTHRLIIAPRHPERSEDILTICQTNHSLATRYSDSTRLSDNTQTLIIDTLGELLYFYSLADFAIIGGSFIPHGGHNPLEAALFATPCIIGEHYFNFETLINEMKTANAIMITRNDDLLSIVRDLTTIGHNAQLFLAQNQGALGRYTHLIQQAATTPRQTNIIF